MVLGCRKIYCDSNVVDFHDRRTQLVVADSCCYKYIIPLLVFWHHIDEKG